MFGAMMNGLTGAVFALLVLGGLSLGAGPVVWLVAPVFVPACMTKADDLLGDDDEDLDDLDD